MVTIKDIAKAAGVTYVTVSRALNDNPGVSEKMRQRIRTIAEQMNYSPNMAAKRLVQRKTKCIGLIWPATQGLFFYHLGVQIQQEGAKRGYRVILSTASPVESMHTFSQLLVDSVIVWVHTQPSVEFLKAVEQFQGEILWLGEEGVTRSHSIAIDRRRGLFEGVRHLAELGHSRIAFVGGVTDKLHGYTEGMAAFKLDYDPQRVIHVHDTGLPHKLAAIMNGTEPPTAMVADSQGALFRVIKTFRQLGVRIPDDISLLVYDDVPELEIFEVSLTTVGPSISKLAAKAVDILTGAAKPEEGQQWINEVMEAELTVRQSTRAMRP
ncbi:MAG: hypothetical protein K0R28_1526 [Paenibacillus sp.]|jgi:LacI family transcriptional regulator|nr:hypothetical protein [Paenibacillus sp.]